MMADKLSHSTSRGIIQIVSNHKIEEIVRRLREVLDSKGVKLFATVDGGGEAASAGMSMPPTMFVDLWQSYGRNSIDVGRAEHRH